MVSKSQILCDDRYWNVEGMGEHQKVHGSPTLLPEVQLHGGGSSSNLLPITNLPWPSDTGSSPTELLLGTGNPRQSAASVSIMVPCHNTLKPDPYLATPFMSSTLSFVLSSKDKMCYINVSPEVLGCSFLFYKLFADLHTIICTYHCLKYF